MGQRHQLFIVGNVNGRYRVLAAVHHQWLYGSGPTKTCWRILQLLQHAANKILIAHELSYAKTRPDKWWDELQRDKYWMDDPVQFPFITTCLVLGASLNGHDVSILSITSQLNEIDNNDGLTIIDVSDINSIRYCFVFLDDMKPLTGEEYYRTYYQGGDLSAHPIPADLSAWDLVEAEVLQDLWPDEDRAEAASSDSVVPDGPTEKLVRSLKSLAFDRLVDQALDDPEQADQLVAAEELADFHNRLRDRLTEAPNLVQGRGGLEVLCLSIQQTDHLDLSPYPWLTESQILQLIEQKGLGRTLISLDLSMNSVVDLGSVRKIVSLCPDLTELTAFYADGLPLLPLLDALDGSKVRRVWHQEHFRLPLSLGKRDNSILEHLSFFTRAGNVIKQGISLQISHPLFGDLASYRLANGGLRWSEVLIEVVINRVARYGGAFGSAVPLLGAMLEPADVIRSGEWTILMIGEEEEDDSQVIRYAFLTRDDKGDLVVADLSEFHRMATKVDANSSEFKTKVENLGQLPNMLRLDSIYTGSESKAEVTVKFCGIDEVMDIVSNILEANEEVVRCVCGEYEEETDDPIVMICCDRCSAWQHNDCMGLSNEYAKTNKTYFCEQCQPEKHKDLLAAMERGERPKKARGTPVVEINGDSTTKKHKSTTSSVSRSAKDLPRARQTPAGNLVRVFIDEAKPLVSSGGVSTGGIDVEAFATARALAVEQAVYQGLSGGAGEPNEAYKAHIRALLLNLKKNRPLMSQVLTQEVSAEELAAMSAKDLATEEQKQADAARQKAHDQQHIIAHNGEQAPRIRRTHKGDEYIDDSHTVAEPADEPAADESEPKVKQEEEAKATPATSPKAAARRQPSVTIPKSGGPRRKSSANFDISNIWSNVKGSPSSEQQPFAAVQQPVSPVREVAGPGTRPDRDIDELLKEDDVESPPYSPKDDSPGDGIVWRGVINGNSLGRFQAIAKYAVGATPDSETLQTTWSTILSGEIGIGGRIDPTKADDYLCGLEWSNSSDLLIVWLPEPDDPLDQQEFNRFFRYFKTKNRFGVGQQNHFAPLKDIYFVPLEKGEEMPMFVKKLESSWPQQASERMLLMPLVRRQARQQPHSRMEQARAQQCNRHRLHREMIGITVPQYRIQHLLYTAAAIPGIAAPVLQPPHLPPAALAASRVLGPHAAKPAVLQLISSAPSAGDEEMKVIKECITQDERAAHDLGLLTQMLQDRHKRQQNGHAQGALEGNAQA
ncbi:hypothetical protein DV735_g446, partial [Chaetothyriales sp. CBS 134920]